MYLQHELHSFHFLPWCSWRWEWNPNTCTTEFDGIHCLSSCLANHACAFTFFTKKEMKSGVISSFFCMNQPAFYCCAHSLFFLSVHLLLKTLEHLICMLLEKGGLYWKILRIVFRVTDLLFPWFWVIEIILLVVALYYCVSGDLRNKSQSYHWEGILCLPPSSPGRQ